MWLNAALIVLLVLIIGQSFFFWLKTARRRWEIHARLARAGRGEQIAATWLEQRGFEILGTQVATQYPVCLNGEALSVSVRADYIVQKNDKRYVVEVKTGASAPRLTTPATRRQILEYRLAFDVNGVLLVDAELGRINEVTFPSFAIPASREGEGWYASKFLLVALATTALVIGVMRFI